MSLTKSPSSSRTPRARAPKAEKAEKAALTDVAVLPPSHDEIARRAYAIFESRGSVHGHYDEDWLQAERELTALRRG